MREWLESGDCYVTSNVSAVENERLSNNGVHSHFGHTIEEVWLVIKPERDKIIVLKGPKLLNIDNGSLFHCVVGSVV